MMFSRLVPSSRDYLTLQNRLQGSIKPLWLFDPGPVMGAN